MKKWKKEDNIIDKLVLIHTTEYLNNKTLSNRWSHTINNTFQTVFKISDGALSVYTDEMIYFFNFQYETKRINCIIK